MLRRKAGFYLTRWWFLLPLLLIVSAAVAMLGCSSDSTDPAGGGDGGGDVEASRSGDDRYLSMHVGTGNAGTFIDVCVWPDTPSDTDCQDCDN